MQTASLRSTGPTSRDTATFVPSQPLKVIGTSMSSAAAFPAKTSALPEKGRALPVSGLVFGMSSLRSFAKYNPDTSSWKTSEPSLLEESTPFSGKWPASGMTRNGIAYRLVLLVPLTAGKESGSLPFGTPTASEKIATAYPTPNMGERFRRRHGGNLLESVAHHMWPTPSASQMPCEGTVRLCRKAWLDGNATLEEASAIAGRDVRKHQGKVPAMLPTQTVQDASNNGGPSQYQRNSLPLNAVAGGALNPTWVEWLMGFPAGWTDLGDSETPSSRKLSKSSAGRSSNRKPK